MAPASLEQHRGSEDQVDTDNEADKPDGSGLVDTIPLDREEVRYTCWLIERGAKISGWLGSVFKHSPLRRSERRRGDRRGAESLFRSECL